MDDKLFKELIQSIKEGGKLLRKIKQEKEKNSNKQLIDKKNTRSSH